ncbi:hypothetical protein NQ317_002181 [Molorchus minor]|uniref:Uncharacterized protein n=1 Tax=Molorchus minor TaxID=1323400 RepID=A0ABQ9IWL3_9CUCU|nr:hypothetical protein NQ317_002181 [Molorchus minor]
MAKAPDPLKNPYGSCTGRMAYYYYLPSEALGSDLWSDMDSEEPHLCVACYSYAPLIQNTTKP